MFVPCSKWLRCRKSALSVNSLMLTSHNPYPFCLHTSLGPLSPQSRALVCAEVLSLPLLVRCQELWPDPAVCYPIFRDNSAVRCYGWTYVSSHRLKSESSGAGLWCQPEGQRHPHTAPMLCFNRSLWFQATRPDYPPDFLFSRLGSPQPLVQTGSWQALPTRKVWDLIWKIQSAWSGLTLVPPLPPAPYFAHTHSILQNLLLKVWSMVRHPLDLNESERAFQWSPQMFRWYIKNGEALILVKDS